VHSSTILRVLCSVTVISDILSFSFPCSRHILVLHSFPTRRSSDSYLFFWQSSLEVEDVEVAAQQKPLKRAPRQRFLLRRNFNVRSEEHTSELQSRGHLVCRLLLDKKNFTLLAVLAELHQEARMLTV